MAFSICLIEIEELFRNPGPFYGPVLQQARPRRKRSEIDNLMSVNCWLSRLSEAAVRIPRECGAAGGVPEPGAGQGQAHAAERGDGPGPGEEEEEGAGGVTPREVRRGRRGRT